MVTQYQQRLEQRVQAALQHEATVSRLSYARLAAVLTGAAAAWWNIWSLPVSVALFIALVVYHERLAGKAAAERRAARFYETAIARTEGEWQQVGSTGERFRDPMHPYANDLDIFGRGSLFQLLSAARTAIGEETLASWLKAPAPADVVLARQQAVRALCNRLGLREDLALLGDELAERVHAPGLSKWAEGPAIPLARGWEWVLLITATLAVVAGLGTLLHLWPLDVLIIVLLVQSAAALLLRTRVLTILAHVDAPAAELDVIAQVLRRFEAESLVDGRLGELRRELVAHGKSAAEQIARLHRLVEIRDYERNQMFAPIAKFVAWSSQSAVRIERWRQAHGGQVRRWLAAAGELEALSSLAGYMGEHEEDVFPDLAGAEAVFAGSAIAHPLLGRNAVRNDVHLDRQQQLLLISGSNMSGKSTLMRSVGLNTVLAWAGAPVRAKALRVSPLQVGASIRVEDSVLDGKSRFYAEITRIRQIVDLANGSIPLLFLLDEVLSGTNSHDRGIGAEAIMRTLVARGAIGLVSTHDLALATAAEKLGSQAANVHFEDHIENGQVVFDYRMRPGVVTKSNALELMRSVGLDV